MTNRFYSPFLPHDLIVHMHSNSHKLVFIESLTISVLFYFMFTYFIGGFFGLFLYQIQISNFCTARYWFYLPLCVKAKYFSCIVNKVKDSITNDIGNLIKKLSVYNIFLFIIMHHTQADTFSVIIWRRLCRIVCVWQWLLFVVMDNSRSSFMMTILFKWSNAIEPSHTRMHIPCFHRYLL